MLELELPLPSIVYRGAQMSKIDIELLQESKNCLIATNGFLSTTRNREVAKIYAGSGVIISRRRGEIHAVIFEFVIPSDLQSIVFADISYLSKMIDEEEVLFDIGTTFIVSDVTYDDVEQTWIIRLIGSDKGRNIVSKEYIEFYREHTKNLSPTIKLGEFLTIVGRYDQARDYFDDLLKVDYENEVHILYSLAWIDQCQGKYKDARVKLDCAYELENQNHSPSQQILRHIIIDNGTIHLLMGEPNLALNCYLKADKMMSSSAVFNNIGLSYRQKRQWDKALEFFNKALARDQHDWPNGHYRIGITLDNIGRTYNGQGKYRRALKFHFRGLKMKQLTLPEDHKDIGISFNNIGLTYNDLEMYDEALVYLMRAVDIYKMCLPEIHREQGILFDNIAIAYRFKEQWNECFYYYQLALHIKEHLDPIDRLILAQTLHNLGVVYADSSITNDQQDDKKAFDYFQRALSMHEANGSIWSLDAATTLYEQARLHERCQEYREAFELLIQALNIQQTTLPRNHPETIKTRTALIGLKIEL
ncbi:unnamed protein product [Rotaria sp. Silwood2]|nr:unnamed protein product [Rotaria sp. Silwood2]CAF2757005.1 unnamed protein product [Rotaria sp. Silwood2]CAF3456806.1 unnamed protein product [Rotaria sp. Silwood2]CAF4147751.1 unnamed protein product [Rotaria sp. Silwood2]CAF4254636.1 unnamed protein product [Rotaria sp. Silwood2]